MLDEKFLNSIKKKLLDLKAQILSRSYQVSSIPDEEKTDVFDMTSVEKIRDVEHIASSIDVETLKMVEHAIEKIESGISGSYGFCEFCGVEIDKERLIEIPYVKYCVDCQEKLEMEEQASKVGMELSESERVSFSDEEQYEEVAEEKLGEEEGLRVSPESGEGAEESEETELDEEGQGIESQILEEDVEVDKEIKEQVEEEIEEEFRKEEKYEEEEEDLEEIESGRRAKKERTKKRKEKLEKAKKEMGKGKKFQKPKEKKELKKESKKKKQFLKSKKEMKKKK